MMKGMELPNKEKNQNARRKGNIQILGNIGSGHDQTNGDEGKNWKKNISGERENYSKQNYEEEIWTVPLVRYSGPFF